MPATSEYYVYVYIDPRNFEEFYYGKGKGLRKNAHLKKLKDLEESKSDDKRYAVPVIGISVW